MRATFPLWARYKALARTFSLSSWIWILQGVRYTALEGEVDPLKIAEILNRYFGTRTSWEWPLVSAIISNAPCAKDFCNFQSTSCGCELLFLKTNEGTSQNIYQTTNEINIFSLLKNIFWLWSLLRWCHQILWIIAKKAKCNGWNECHHFN